MGEYLVHARGLLPAHHALFCLGVLAVEHGFYLFLFHQGEDGGSRLEGIDKLVQEVELALLAVFLGFLTVVVQPYQYFFVLVVLVVCLVLGAVAVPSGYHLLDELHGGVVLLAVAFFLGFHGYFLQGDVVGCQADVEPSFLVGTEGDLLGDVA